MIIIESIYKKAEIDELVDKDVGRVSTFRGEGGSEELMEAMNSELSKQYFFIKNKIPSALLITAFLGMGFVFIFYAI